MQLGRIHGFALIVLGVVLLGLQTMLYMTPEQVVIGSPEPSTTSVERDTYPAPGILCMVFLTAGVAILVARRGADEPEAKNAVK